MCLKHSIKSVFATGQARSSKPVIEAAIENSLQGYLPVGAGEIATSRGQQEKPSKTRKNRRKRLWDLAPVNHCPVIGVCFDVAEVRHLMGRVNGADALDDYELHVRAVHFSGSRNDIARLLTRELDKRYAGALQRYSAATGPEAIAEIWRADLANGRAAGGLWASLTHPLCDEDLANHIYGDIHLLQHQAAAQARIGVRISAAEKAELAEQRVERTELQEQLIRAQSQHQKHSRELTTERDQALVENRVLLEKLAKLERDDEPGDQAANEQRLQRANRHLQAQLERATEQLTQLKRELAKTQESSVTVSTTLRSQLIENSPDCSSPELCDPEAFLDGRKVLCVGGRPRSIASYRSTVEKLGGRFDHHDGGVEQNIAQLDPAMSGADLVVCQSSCVSHTAYWRVKRYCRRSGKPCVYLESTGVKSLIRTLAAEFKEQASADETRQAASIRAPAC